MLYLLVTVMQIIWQAWLFFFKQQIFFSFVNAKTITIFGDLFLSVKFTFLFH